MAPKRRRSHSRAQSSGRELSPPAPEPASDAKRRRCRTKGSKNASIFVVPEVPAAKVVKAPKVKAKKAAPIVQQGIASRPNAGQGSKQGMIGLVAGGKKVRAKATVATKRKYTHCGYCGKPVADEERYKGICPLHEPRGKERDQILRGLAPDPQLKMAFKKAEKDGGEEFERVKEIAKKNPGKQLKAGTLMAIKNALTIGERNQSVTDQNGYKYLNRGEWSRRMSDVEGGKQLKWKKIFDKRIKKPRKWKALWDKGDKVYRLPVKKPPELNKTDSISLKLQSFAPSQKDLNKLSKGFCSSNESGLAQLSSDFGGLEHLQIEDEPRDGDEEDEGAEAEEGEEEEGEGEEEEEGEGEEEEDELAAIDVEFNGEHHNDDSDGYDPVDLLKKPAAAATPASRKPSQLGGRLPSASPPKYTKRTESYDSFPASHLLDPADPSHLLCLKERTKRIVVTTADSFVVGTAQTKQDAAQYVQQRFDEVSEDKRVKCLGMQGIIDAAKATAQELRKMAEDLDGWTPSEWGKKKIEVDTAIDDFHKAFKAMMDYDRGLTLIKTQHRSAKQVEGRKERDRVERVKQVVGQENIPPAMARYLASLLEPVFKNDVINSFYAVSDGNSKGFSLEINDHWNFLKPGGMISKLEKDQTPWHRELDKAYAKFKKECDSNIPLAIEKFKADTSATHLTTPFLATGPYVPFPDGGDKNFQLAANMSPYATYLKPHLISFALKAQPLITLTSFISCTSGLLSITFVELASVLLHGKGIESMEDYLGKVDKAYLMKQPTMFLAAGDHCYCPLGWIPIIVANPSGSAASEDEIAAYVTYPLLDLNQLAKLHVNCRAEIKAWILKGREVVLRVYMGPNGTAVDKWMEEWPAPATEKTEGSRVSPFEDTQSPISSPEKTSPEILGVTSR